MRLLPPPGPERTRQVILLGVMLVVIAGVAWYQFSGAPAAAPAAESNPQTAMPGGSLGPLPEALRLASLDDEGGEPVSQRNPFRFGQPPAPPAPPPVPRPPVTPPPLPPPAPTGPPMIPLELVGIWQAEGVRWATLRTPSKRTVQATEGSTVDGRYRLVAIQERSVIVTYLDGSGRRTIPLQGGGHP